MYHTQPVASPYLDIAEKSRAYGRHTHALIHNVHVPISTPPVVAPSVLVYRRRRDGERKKSIKENKLHTSAINTIFKRQHNIPIANDVTELTKKSQISPKSQDKQWAKLLQETEACFPTQNERKHNKNRSSNSSKCERAHSTFKEPESGMSVSYEPNESQAKEEKSNESEVKDVKINENQEKENKSQEKEEKPAGLKETITSTLTNEEEEEKTKNADN